MVFILKQNGLKIVTLIIQWKLATLINKYKP